MLKIRLMGSKNDIKWFERQLKKNPRIEVRSVSQPLRNKGTDLFYRAYADIYKTNIKE